MKVILPGGQGLVGSILAPGFVSRGDEVVILTRTPKAPNAAPGARAMVRYVQWDGKNSGDWCRELDGADVVINLAGRSVNCRQNKINRQQIVNSRVDSTRAIGQAIMAATDPPAVWLQSSTATIYPHTLGKPNTEESAVSNDEPDAPRTWRFSVDVAKQWESAAEEIELESTRLVLLRTSLVMSSNMGGVFDVLLGLVRKGLGGRNGSGKQFVSWIHYRDFARAIDWLIRHEDIVGPVNLASPNPVANSEFMAEIRRHAGVKFGLPAPKWLLEIGAIFMKTETELILKSRCVYPKKLLDSGFAFEFADWSDTVHDLVKSQAENLEN